MSTLAVRPFMHALPATAISTPEVGVAAPSPATAAPANAAPAAADPPWLYRSEGFAEDLDTDPAHEPKPDSAFLRWGLPTVMLLGVVGLAAAFSLV